VNVPKSRLREVTATVFRQRKQRLDTCPWIPQASAHLLTTPGTQHTPRAEVFAVIGQQSISVFAETGPGSLHGFDSVINSVWFGLNLYSVSRRKVAQRNIFNGTTFDGLKKASVVDDQSIPCIYSMVRIAFPLTHEMSADLDAYICSDQRRRHCKAINL
jgi:hypothetical protein